VTGRDPDLPAPLPRTFYERPTPEVAADLLGRLLIRTHGDGTPPLVARIAEVEAYGGPVDLASHARAGLTRRTAPMYGPAGHAYVYLIYGMHHCLNVVAEGDRRAGAALLRAVEPIRGIEQMQARRGRPADPVMRLCAGPARICQAMGIDLALDGHDLTDGVSLWIATPAGWTPPGPDEIVVGRRVGVESAGPEATSRPWRFGLRGSPALSRAFRPV
jgi:DNA-3-methyladenine glycosylase